MGLSLENSSSWDVFAVDPAGTRARVTTNGDEIRSECESTDPAAGEEESASRSA